MKTITALVVLFGLESSLTASQSLYKKYETLAQQKSYIAARNLQVKLLREKKELQHNALKARLQGNEAMLEAVLSHDVAWFIENLNKGFDIETADYYGSYSYSRRNKLPPQRLFSYLSGHEELAMIEELLVRGVNTKGTFWHWGLSKSVTFDELVESRLDFKDMVNRAEKRKWEREIATAVGLPKELTNICLEYVNPKYGKKSENSKQVGNGWTAFY
jgi:hypothetical protein